MQPRLRVLRARVQVHTGADQLQLAQLRLPKRPSDVPPLVPEVASVVEAYADEWVHRVATTV